MKYLIIGAGPAGLGAGWHLDKKGIKDWLILEKESYAGGLSASFKDKKGFYWDLGGHVLFGNNREFIGVIKDFLGKDLVKHRRKAAIYFRGKFVPYPFQDNIKRSDLAFPQGPTLKPVKQANFKQWLYFTFGRTLSEIFFIPQNEKSWAYPLSKMSYSWIEKRIKLPAISARSDLNGTGRLKKTKTNWGGNASFYYPKTGGIGVVWQKMAQSYGNKIKFKNEVIAIDIGKKKVYLKTGKIIDYEYLISTMPLNVLLRVLLPQKKRNEKLKHNKGLIIGLGIKGKLNNDFHWLYYPQKEFPFFRLVFTSNFSQSLKNNCSITAEISLKQNQVFKKDEMKSITCKVVKQVKELNLFRGNIISVFQKQVDYFYPIPTLKRDDALRKINMFLNKKQIYSIGRFGGWKYEEGNMDDGFLACSKKNLIILKL